MSHLNQQFTFSILDFYSLEKKVFLWYINWNSINSELKSLAAKVMNAVCILNPHQAIVIVISPNDKLVFRKNDSGLYK